MGFDRIETHLNDSCWQFDIRQQNLEDDLKLIGLSVEEAGQLTCGDFSFAPIVELADKKKCRAFIEKHEWLGTLSQYTTHWFATFFRQEIAGVCLMNVPNAFSKLLGDETPQLERLISRGACISWSPKNLGSHLVMQSISWMAKNTPFRLFTAYADPMAKELGTIYQACNFYYLGNQAGTTQRYINPYTGKLVSDRFFRQRTAYKKYAQELNIVWDKEWTSSTGMLWNNMPQEIASALREYSKVKQKQSQQIIVPSKHKYAYVLGATPKETKALRRVFLQRNKIYKYPKQRGK